MRGLCFSILGVVSAGFPKASEGYEEQPINLQELLISRPAATFFFRVSGDVLRPEGIPDGAVLIVDRSIPPRPGMWVVVEHDARFAVCRLNTEPVIVCGVVTASIVRF